MSDRIRLIHRPLPESPQHLGHFPDHQSQSINNGNNNSRTSSSSVPGQVRESSGSKVQNRESLMNVNLWKAYLYELQLKAPTPRRVVATRPLLGIPKPAHYGREYHGRMSREESEKILKAGRDISHNNSPHATNCSSATSSSGNCTNTSSSDGSFGSATNKSSASSSNSGLDPDTGRYLVRESDRNQGQITLSLRFNGITKNFRLFFDGHKHFVGEKRFDTIHDLVADSLITLYLELHAADYIASLGSAIKYEESPYMTLHRRHSKIKSKLSSKSKLVIPRSKVLEPVLKSPAHSSSPNNGASSSNPVLEAANKRHGRIQSSFEGIRLSSNLVPTEIDSKQLSSNSSGAKNGSGSKNGSSSKIEVEEVPDDGTERSSSVLGSVEEHDAMLVANENQGEGDEIDVQMFEKCHVFKNHNFIGLPFCDFCANFMWGILGQGVKCEDCGFSAHRKCSEKVPADCCPDLRFVKRVFGIDLTTLVKACNTARPFVVDACIKEIEFRGLHVEGLYRVSGFADDVEALKLRLECSEESTSDNPSELTAQQILRTCDDVHVITGVLKLYFRLLPIPLITFDTYPVFVCAIRKSSEIEKLSSMKDAVNKLPAAHYQTLKYFIAHLVRVTSFQEQNLMTAHNLSTVFCPTILKTPNICLMPFQMSAWTQEADVVEFLINNHSQLFTK